MTDLSIVDGKEVVYILCTFSVMCTVDTLGDNKH
jgi:hypothetical protein